MPQGACTIRCAATENRTTEPPFAQCAPWKEGTVLSCKTAPTRFIATVIVLSVILTGIVILQLLPSRQDVPQASDGVLDLTGGRLEQECVNLMGEWEFFWDKLLTKEDFQQGVSGGVPVSVPAVWNSYRLEGEPLPAFGYATYRLHVLVDEPEPLAVYLESTSTAYRMFVDGTEIASNGTVGDAPASARPGYLPTTAFFTPQSREFDLIIQVSNFSYARGGLWYSIRLGTAEKMASTERLILYKDILTIGCLAVMALYYLVFFWLNREVKSALYFAILSLAQILRASYYGHNLLGHLFPAIPFGLEMLIPYLTMFWLPDGLYLLVMSLFRGSGNEESHFFSRLGRLLTGLAAAETVVVCLLPMQLYSALLPFFQIVVAFVLLSVLVLIGHALAQGRRDSKAVFITLWFIILLVLLDMLSQWGLLIFPFSELSSLGFTVFIFLFSGLLASRFSSTYEQNRTLVARLEEALEKERELGRTLARYDRLKDDFLLKTSHELQAPLHSIMNLLEAAGKQPEAALPSSLRENLSYALITARRMNSLIRDISDFEALRLGSLKLSCDTIDMSAPLRGVAEIMSPLFREKGLALHLQVREGECIVLADESRLRQIFFTLLGNAMKYTQRGSVAVLARPEGDRVTVFVRDTGVGLQDNRKDTLFHYFESFKTEDAYSATPDTSGIGLAIARSLALQMGGGLELGWSEPGRGTELVLTLPTAPGVRREAGAEETVAAHWEEPVPVSLPLDVPTGAKILVVDDEVTNIRSVESLLGGLCSVLAAYSGAEALELLLREGEVDLVILDMMLPGLSGFEICHRIRERHTPFELPILLAAARPGPEEIEAGLAAGANDFVSKPFDARELRARAGSLLELRRSVKEAVGLELAFLRSQINPHFLFNALSIIVSLCYTDGRRAGDLLGEFSACLRYSFDFDPENAFAPLGRELEVVRSYLTIEQARFGPRLQVQYGVPETLLRRNIPVLCLQTLVENAVRHGLMKRLEGGTVFIGAEETAEGGLLLTVRDDGVGLLPNYSGEGGVGLRNIRRRLAALKGAGLELCSLSEGGTEALLRLPVLPVQNEENEGVPL